MSPSGLPLLLVFLNPSQELIFSLPFFQSAHMFFDDMIVSILSVVFYLDLLFVLFQHFLWFLLALIRGYRELKVFKYTPPNAHTHTQCVCAHTHTGFYTREDSNLHNSTSHANLRAPSIF